MGISSLCRPYCFPCIIWLYRAFMIMCGPYIRVTSLCCAVLTLSPYLIGNGPKPQPNTPATWETCSAVIGSVMVHHCASPQMRFPILCSISNFFWIWWCLSPVSLTNVLIKPKFLFINWHWHYLICTKRSSIWWHIVFSKGMLHVFVWFELCVYWIS